MAKTRSRHGPPARQDGKGRRLAEMIHAPAAAARNTSDATASNNCFPAKVSLVSQMGKAYVTSRSCFPRQHRFTADQSRLILARRNRRRREFEYVGPPN